MTKRLRRRRYLDGLRQERWTCECSPEERQLDSWGQCGECGMIPLDVLLDRQRERQQERV